MPIEPVFEKITAKEKVGEAVRQVKVECKTDVPSEVVERVLNDNVYASVVLGEVGGGRADFIGKATFFICYVTEDGIKKCECGAEIKDSLISDLISEGDRIKISWEADKVETDLSGLKMTASAYLTVKGEIFRKTEYSALTGGDGVYCDLKGVQTVKSYGTVSSGYSAEEEFELNFPVAEVLSHRAEVCLTQVQCGVGTVICDGEIFLSEILLQSGDKNDIIRENRVIPFRAEAECEDAMPQLSATCRAFVKSLKTDVSVDEEKNVSTLTAQVLIGLTGEAYAVTEETVATDAFHTDNELTLLKSHIAFIEESAPASSVSRIVGRAAVEDIGSARLITVVSERAETSSVAVTDSGAMVSGAFSVNLLFMGEDGKVFNRKAEIPFETSIVCPTDGAVSVTVVPKAVKAKLVTLTEIECETEAAFTAYVQKNYAAQVVSGVEVGEAKPITDAAVSVYIPCAGEGLWGLAKRLNVCPEKLVATNPDLQFPLTGKERIAIYRQK